MRKASISIKGPWGQTRSKNPANSAFINDNDLTAGSKNFETESKDILKKRKGGVVYNSDDILSNPIKDQYEAIFTDGTRHLLAVQSGEVKYSTGDGSFNSVTNGTGFSSNANFEFTTILNRVYGDNAVNGPIVYDKTASYGGVDYSGSVPRVKNMGAQIPSTAPTFNSFIAGGNIPDGTYNYKVTYIYYTLEESNGSASSSPAITVTAPNSTVRLNIPVGGYGVTARKIYREDTAAPGLFLLVGTVLDNTSTTFDDTASTGTTFIPVDNNVPPVFGQILSHLDRAWIAQIPGEPYTLRHSSVSKPDLFPDNNFIICNQGDPISAIVVYLDRIIILNRNSIGQVAGRASDTFRYSHIPGSVGCVDNRSIQIRTIEGIPTLLWLSDKGIYSYNGNSIDYVSDPIEDLVNFNIKQVVQTKDKNTQTSKSDFQAGTFSEGIDLDSLEGSITAKGPINGNTSLAANPTDPTNPRRVWDTQAVWELGTLSNIATINTSNQIRAATNFDFQPGTQGQRSNIIPTGSNNQNITLSTSSDFSAADNITGVTSSLSGTIGLSESPIKWAQPYVIPRAGTLTAFDVSVLYGGQPRSVRAVIWDDSSGLPNSTLAIGPTVALSGDTTLHVDTSFPITGNTRIWIGIEFIGGNLPGGASFADPALSSFGSGKYKIFNGTTWKDPDEFIWSGTGTTDSQSLKLSFSFVSDPVAKSGEWISPTADLQSTSAEGDLLSFNASYPAGTSSETTVEAGESVDSNGDLIPQISETFNNVDGTETVTLANKRYWRVKIILRTDDDRVTPTVSANVSVEMKSTGTWISEPLDLTTDITSYDSLTETVSFLPSGGSVTAEARSSTTKAGLTGESWAAIGSVVVRKWFQARVTIVKGSLNVSPRVDNLTLTYSLSANIISQPIDTGISGGPAGWDIFQSTFELNGNTVVFEMRSAASSGDLTGATWFTVTAGNYPTTSLPHLQFVQWRATITSSSNSIPIIEDVVTNWLITDEPSTRVASIFHDKIYVLSVAEFNETTNSALIVLDSKNNWRIWRGITVSTFSLFFNDVYYGNAVDGKLIKFRDGFLDEGSNNIEFDIRSKAFDFSNTDADLRHFRKIVKKLFITGYNTGASYQAFYSVDNGITFNSFLTDSGNTSFTTSSDGQPFEVRLKASHDINSSYSGKTVMWRILNNDNKEVELDSIKLEVLTRRGETSENV